MKDRLVRNDTMQQLEVPFLTEDEWLGMLLICACLPAIRSNKFSINEFLTDFYSPNGIKDHESLVKIESAIDVITGQKVAHIMKFNLFAIRVYLLREMRSIMNDSYHSDGYNPDLEDGEQDIYGQRFYEEFSKKSETIFNKLYSDLLSMGVVKNTEEVQEFLDNVFSSSEEVRIEEGTRKFFMFIALIDARDYILNLESRIVNGRMERVIVYDDLNGKQHYFVDPGRVQSTLKRDSGFDKILKNLLFKLDT